MATKVRKRRVKKNIPNGVAHIHSTFNNTIVTITDPDGNAVAWSSAGALGFKGSKKSTPFAASQASEACAKAALDNGMIKVEVEVKDKGGDKEGVVVLELIPFDISENEFGKLLSLFTLLILLLFVDGNNDLF